MSFYCISDHDGTTTAVPANNGGNSQPLVMPSTACCASAGLFPIPCLNFQETSNLFLTADPARQVVCFSKCKKETAFSFYTPKPFIDACL